MVYVKENMYDREIYAFPADCGNVDHVASNIVSDQDAVLPLARVKRLCMALIRRYLQDDSWRFCSEAPKLVSVSQHLRQPVNLYYPQLVTVPRVTIVTRVRMTCLK